MNTPSTVRTIAAELDVWTLVEQAVSGRVDSPKAEALLGALATLPVKTSRATGLLGSYAHRGGQALCIRLQPRQERELMRTTLLHELAHACEHLLAPDPHRHRCSHGPAWRAWALAFGIPPSRSSRSRALEDLRQQRLKPVAVCARCGCVFHRLRRLPQRRQWVHPECGNGRIVPLTPGREESR
jgi:hypothetical protein